MSREEHQPPTDIVSKQIDMWGVGKETTTKLFTSKGEVRDAVCMWHYS